MKKASSTATTKICLSNGDGGATNLASNPQIPSLRRRRHHHHHPRRRRVFRLHSRPSTSRAPARRRHAHPVQPHPRRRRPRRRRPPARRRPPPPPRLPGQHPLPLLPSPPRRRRAGGGDPLTSTYLDVFATIPPLLPKSAASLAVLGFGAGSAARAILHFYPNLTSLHGWEIDPAVISVSRDFFDLADLESKHADRLFVHVGDALVHFHRHAEGGVVFGGVLVDLFANGSVVPELQEASTWRRIGGAVAADGGRIMVNCGGPCVQAEEEGRDGEAVKDATLGALVAAFGCEMVSVMEVDQSWVAMTGPAVSPAMAAAWKGNLPPELRRYVDMWRPCSP